jgi:hypothetical protein
MERLWPKEARSRTNPSSANLEDSKLSQYPGYTRLLVVRLSCVPECALFGGPAVFLLQYPFQHSGQFDGATVIE